MLSHLFVSVALLFSIAAAMFVPAGRIDLPYFWGLLAIGAAAIAIATWTVDEGLQQERIRPGPGGWDLLPFLAIGAPCVLAHFAIAGLDRGRFHWSDIPDGTKICALVVAAAATAAFVWAMRANRFFSVVIRLQSDRDHCVATTGPYRWVRHPGYAAAIVMSMCSPIVLGSWWSALPLIPWLVVLVRRTVLEDAFLVARLDGYSAYATQVRHRLVPGLW